MSWVWGIAAIAVLLAFLAVTRLLRRLVFAFTLAAVGLLLLHMRESPGEAMAALGALGGGLALAWPLRRIAFGSVL